MSDFAAFVATITMITAFLHVRRWYSRRDACESGRSGSLREIAVRSSDPAADWAFKAEGGANVALTYVGPARRLRGHLLRVRKVVRGKHATRASQSPHPDSSASLLPNDPLQYAATVMRPLLGDAYVIPGVRVHVPRQWIERLVADAVLGSPLRPPHRTRAAGTLAAFLLPPTLDERHSGDAGEAVLMVDHSRLPRGWGSSQPTVCVELKPKAGIHDATLGQPCRFCLHQLVKPFEGDDPLARRMRQVWRTGLTFTTEESLAARVRLEGSVSDYCPQDLFSRQPARVETAIAALARQPGNNMRVFVDGVPLPPAGLQLPEAVAATLAPYPAWCTGGASATAWTVVAAALVQSLVEDDVLQRILEAQALDHGGPTQLLDRVRARFPHCTSAPDLMEALVAQLPPDDPLRQQATTYMQAATAKDCSLLIAMGVLPPLDIAGGAEADADGDDDGGLGDMHTARHRRVITVIPEPASAAPPVRLLVSVAIVDVDPKPLARLARHAELQDELTACWRTVGHSIAPARWLASRPCWRRTPTSEAHTTPLEVVGLDAARTTTCGDVTITAPAAGRG